MNETKATRNFVLHLILSYNSKEVKVIQYIAVVIGEYRIAGSCFSHMAKDNEEWSARFRVLGKSLSTIRMVGTIQNFLSLF